MKSKWHLITSILQIIVGLAAIISFFILRQTGESMTKWIITFILAIAFVIIGIIKIVDYIKEKEN